MGVCPFSGRVVTVEDDCREPSKDSGKKGPAQKPEQEVWRGWFNEDSVGRH